MHDGVRADPPRLPAYRSTSSRVAAICGLSSTLWSAPPGVDVSSAMAVSLDAEHVRRPRRGVEQARVDRVGPPLGIDRAGSP